MILKEISYDLSGICRAIIEGDKGIEYVTNVSIEGNSYDTAWCTCSAFVFSKTEMPCKHINFLVSRLDRSKMVDKKKELSRIPTGSKIIDDLLGGGAPMKLITTLFGEPMSGKTLLGYQIGINNIKLNDKETLLIDTEGVLEEDLNSLLYKFGNRVGVDKELIADKFRMVKTYNDKQVQSIQKLMMMFGYMPKMELSEGGKYKLIFNTCKETLTEKELENISCIIVDSLTKPVKDSVGSETANLPARAQIVERLFGKFYQVAELHNIAIVVLHHASINPAPHHPGQDPGHVYGGNPIYYNSKYILQILRGTAKEKELSCGEDKNEIWGQGARRVQLIRRPNEQATGLKIPVRIRKDWGFTDS